MLIVRPPCGRRVSWLKSTPRRAWGPPVDYGDKVVDTSGRFLPHAKASRVARNYRLRKQEDVDHYRDGLIKAGLPELQLWVKTRRTGAPPGRSAPGGEADQIGTKADVGLECRLLGVERTYLGHGRIVRF